MLVILKEWISWFFMPKKIDKSFFPPDSASEAMSNWVVKPEEWLVSLKKSKHWAAEQVCKNEHIVKPLAVAIIAGVTAPLDCYYQVVWFAVKFIVVSTRGVVQLLTGDKWGHYAETVTNQQVKNHLYKSSAYFGAIFAAPTVGVAAAAVTSYDSAKGKAITERVIEAYRDRKLIVGKTSRFQAALDKLKEAGEVVMDKIDDGKTIVLEKVKKGKEIVLKNKAVTSAAAVGLALAAKGASVVLQKAGESLSVTLDRIV